MFEAIDWNRPWLHSFQPLATPIVTAPDWRHALNDAASERRLSNVPGLPIRFVPQAELPAGTPYEAYIYATGRVPTRDNLHDFFNALAWLGYPCIKRQLNAIQASEIAGKGGRVGAHRGPARDAATLFDENAAFFFVRRDDDGRAISEALHAHCWQELFLRRRPMFMQDCAVTLFGHALMEKLVRPYKAITAHAVVMAMDDRFFDLDEHDRRLAADVAISMLLTRERVSRSLFTPLPVLGVPGWQEEQDDAFYDDVAVFRPKRMTPGRGALPESDSGRAC